MIGGEAARMVRALIPTTPRSGDILQCLFQTTEPPQQIWADIGAFDGRLGTAACHYGILSEIGER